MRLAPTDIARLAVLPLRTRRLRVALSIGGVAIGIAAMVAVLGISQSSQSDLLARLDRLGTNLLTVTPGRADTTIAPTLPSTAAPMIAREPDVQAVSGVTSLPATARRSQRVAPIDTAALTVNAAHPDLLPTLRATLAQGRFLNRITERYRTVVLGADAATQLGVDQTNGHAQIYIANQWFTVIGILNHIALGPELDRSALVGFPEAAHFTGAPLRPTTIYVRTNPDNVASVQGVLAAAANPASPNTVSVSRPSDLLTARTAATTTFTGLFLGLGALTLLVGGLGCANVMVIAVLERRTEIGIRRAVGATKSNIANQFLAESLVLSALGAIVGIAMGITATTIWARYRDWRPVIPTSAPITALAAAILVGLTAGLYPALRAARLPPTVALRAA